MVAAEDEGEEGDCGIVTGYKNYLVFCDDSGLHGSTHYGFGSLWLPYERRGDLQRRVQELREKRRLRPDEIKWNKINRGNKSFYLDLVDELFTRPWLMFHCLVVRKGYVDKEFHDGDYDLARRKHFGMLLKAKVKRLAKGQPDRAYHVRVDKLPSSYEKADEVALKIVNAELTKQIGVPALKTLYTRDSKTVLGIQLADLFLGAVLDDVCGLSQSEHKNEVKQAIARHLEWPDLKSATFASAMKFNIWHFCTPELDGGWEVTARAVPSRFTVAE